MSELGEKSYGQAPRERIKLGWPDLAFLAVGPDKNDGTGLQSLDRLERSWN